MKAVPAKLIKKKKAEKSKGYYISFNISGKLLYNILMTIILPLRHQLLIIKVQTTPNSHLTPLCRMLLVQIITMINTQVHISNTEMKFNI